MYRTAIGSLEIDVQVNEYGCLKAHKLVLVSFYTVGGSERVWAAFLTPYTKLFAIMDSARLASRRLPCDDDSSWADALFVRTLG